MPLMRAGRSRGASCVYVICASAHGRALDLDLIEAGDAVRLGPQRDLPAERNVRSVVGGEAAALKGDREPIAFGLQAERVPLSRSDLDVRARQLSRRPFTTR